LFFSHRGLLETYLSTINFVNVINRNCREYIKYYTITRGEIFDISVQNITYLLSIISLNGEEIKDYKIPGTGRRTIFPITASAVPRPGLRSGPY